MQDIVISIYLQIAVKDHNFKEAFVNGVLAGLSVQREMTVVGKVFYDDSLVHAVRNAGRKSAIALIREMGGMYENILSEGNFVGWNGRADKLEDYSSGFVKGVCWVCNLYQELTTANLSKTEVKVILWNFVEDRMTDLKKII